MSKILIIEDDIFFGDALLQKLQACGFETLLSRDSASGLNQLGKQHPDLVLLDSALPRMGGYELLEAKQKDPAIARVPVIIITGSDQPAEIDRAFALGVKDYIVKSEFNQEEAVAKIRSQLTEGGISAAAGASESAEARPKPQSPAGLAGKKIMWVEDDKFLSDIIARKLSTQGCILFHATEGEEALRMLQKERPDLVLLDILLSGIDGFEILERIKSNEGTKHTPVILLSNLGQKADIEKGRTLGAARFLVKATVTLDEIIEEIKTVLKEVSRK